jgi:hypothetical protein
MLTSLELNLQAERAKDAEAPLGALLFQPEGFSLGHCRQNNNTQQGDYQELRARSNVIRMHRSGEVHV